MRTKQKIDPNAIYVAVEAFVTEDNRVVKQGGRLRGDDPLVRHAPHLFIHDGASDEEVGQARAAALDRLFDVPSSADPNAAQLPGQLTPDHPHALVVTEVATFTLEDGSLVSVHEGDLVDDREAWVVKARRLRRGLFRKANLR